MHSTQAKALRNSRCGGLFALSLMASAPISAQTRTNVPDEAKELIVRVNATFDTLREVADVGAGIMFSVDQQFVYIVTAKHVVWRESPASVEVLFWAPGQESTPGRHGVAAEIIRVDSVLDLAVLRVRHPGAGGYWNRPALTRMGRARHVKPDDRVSPVGCPQGDCWGAPAVGADRVMGTNRLEIRFSSFFVGPGSSGGALFNDNWEIVGMVVQDAPPQGIALPWEMIRSQLANWGLQERLRAPAVPRGGYRAAFGVALLSLDGAPSTAFPEGRVPSGRVTLSYHAGLAVVHAGALRLAPDNVNVNAGVVGLGLGLKVGRLMLHPFVEAAIGRIETRYDIGSFLVTNAGVTEPQPVFQRAEEDRIGAGVGVSFALTVLPRTIVEFVGGYWGFPTPAMPGIDTTFVARPDLTNVYAGVGLRLGL